ncbi:coiled-coil domain-containing protein 16 [Ophiostoma piceae UAMH 11346]|uniref:Coiled-coil domain-containing protein 16 n=1 Tax=Ophiostoma piceae (strain UAMH 11346) TaxID=1262450 RepID=S3BRY0_OPHP1|nr:coiled-coil domain-containing protein 16 [Ophiostoma piceae UAMH 11346]
MADVRAMLRQQRSARRIDHPHAVYSDSGKLSCSVCREPVRLESAWDDHVRSQLHRTSVTKLRAQAQTQAQPANALGLSDNIGNGNAHKRRRSDAMEDDGDIEMGSDGDDERGKKRTRSEAPPATIIITSKPQIQIQVPVTQASQSRATSTSTNGDTRKTSAQLTPPLGRRSSGTPVHGVEMRIPSRPATPIANKDSFLGGSSFSGVSNSNSGSNSNVGSGLMSSASTPKIGHLGRSPLIQSDSGISKPSSRASAVASAAAALSAATSSLNSTPATAALAQVDEDEWAAFEAEVVNAPAVAAAAATANAKPDFTGVAVITGAAVSADGTLADTGEETTRREAEEAKLVDEREEATRALEDEFEDMHELESRVRKLKEKREALRSQSAGSNTVAATVAPTVVPASTEDVRRPSATMIDKENIRQQLAAAQKGSTSSKGEPAIAEEEDDDDDDEDADWDAFRFKA